MSQLKLQLDYGVTKEQSCVMCHLSSECSKCCNQCRAKGTECSRQQTCSIQSREKEGSRWEAWVNLTRKGQPLNSLRKYIPTNIRKRLHL